MCLTNSTPQTITKKSSFQNLINNQSKLLWLTGTWPHDLMTFHLVLWMSIDFFSSRCESIDSGLIIVNFIALIFFRRHQIPSSVFNNSCRCLYFDWSSEGNQKKKRKKERGKHPLVFTLDPYTHTYDLHFNENINKQKIFIMWNDWVILLRKPTSSLVLEIKVKPTWSL